MRIILDCSESIRNDLGPTAEILPENELGKRLGDIRIGYQATTSDGNMRHRIVSGLTTKGYTERLDDFDVKIHKGLDRMERVLNKTVPILNRIDEHFIPINKIMDPVHDAMNSKFDRASAALISSLRPENGRRKPTGFEVYEDLNMHF
jgi:hypothetical protein